MDASDNVVSIGLLKRRANEAEDGQVADEELGIRS
jgi:hypothetical protein